MSDWLVVLLVCFVAYELVEHVVFPLYWAVKNRNRASACGPDAMVGKEGLAKHWSGLQGKVTLGNELWNARSESEISPGSKVIVAAVDGLTLVVKPADE